MYQVIICSDVVSYRVGTEYSQLKKYKFLLLNGAEDFVILEYPKIDFEILKEQVALTISSSLLKRTVIPQRITKMNFKDETIELDLRNNEDWEVAFLIDLYNMILTVRKLKGSLFLINDNKLKDNWKGEILAFLRSNNGDVLSIRDGIKKKWKEIGFDKNIIEDEIIAGLSFLQNYGMVTYSDINSLYEITARGYLYR